MAYDFSAIWIEKQQLAKRLVRFKAGSHVRCVGTKMALSAVAEQFALFELRLLEANDNPVSGLHQAFNGQKSTAA